MEKELLRQISKKIDVLITLLLMPKDKGRSRAENVELLLRFSLSNQEIAEILGTTKGTVEVLKSRIKLKK